MLILGAVMVFGVVATRLGDRVSVLAVAHDVPAGAVLATADLVTVSAVDARGLGLVPAEQIESVTGRAAAVPLRTGTLLTWSLVGEPDWPPAGQAVVSLALKAGQYPRQLPAGARVVVHLTGTGPSAEVVEAAPSGSVATSDPAAVPAPDGGSERVVATVVEVAASAEGSHDAVVTLLIPEPASGLLARAQAADTPGLVLVRVPAGTR